MKTSLTYLIFCTAVALVGIGAATPQDIPDHLLLKDYQPRSIYHVPETKIVKAKYPVIDMHSHAYAKTPEQVREWVNIMSQVGVEKTVILTMAYGAKFDQIKQLYSPYPAQFELWCGIDFSQYNTPQFPASAIKELENCAHSGGKG